MSDCVKKKSYPQVTENLLTENFTLSNCCVDRKNCNLLNIQDEYFIILVISALCPCIDDILDFCLSME